MDQSGRDDYHSRNTQRANHSQQASPISRRGSRYTIQTNSLPAHEWTEHSQEGHSNRDNWVDGSRAAEMIAHLEMHQRRQDPRNFPPVEVSMTDLSRQQWFDASRLPVDMSNRFPNHVAHIEENPSLHEHLRNASANASVDTGSRRNESSNHREAEQTRNAKCVSGWQMRCLPLAETGSGTVVNSLFVPSQITIEEPEGYQLDFIVTTWNRDSHDLFDYEATDNKVLTSTFSIPVSGGTTSPQLLLRIRLGAQDEQTSPYDVLVKMVDSGSESFKSDLIPEGRTVDSIEVLLQMSVKKRGQSYEAYLENPEQKHLDMFDFAIYPANTKGIFEVIRDREQENQHDANALVLKEQMLLKLGRYPIKVLQLVASGDPACPTLELIQADKEAINRTTTLVPSESHGIQCRICLGEGGALDDPLVSACVCRGSIQYIHATCLKFWFKSSQDNDSSNQAGTSSKCNINAVSCELCKSQFPPFVMIPTEDDADTTEFDRFELTSLSKLQTPFVVFETLQQNGNERLYANSLEPILDSNADVDMSDSVRQSLKVGRGHESHMRIGDVSISRVHAEIMLEDGHFVLRDKNSKFGTLAKCEQPVILNYGSGERRSQTRASLQCGRSVVDCILRPLQTQESKASMSHEEPETIGSDDDYLNL